MSEADLARPEAQAASTHGTFFWNELMTHDVEQAKRFYGAAIGWTFESMSAAGPVYWIAKMGGRPVGGMFIMDGPDFANMKEQWLPYIAVDDVDARVAKASAAGAKVMRPAFDIPGVGRIAILLEPGGAMIGFMTPRMG